MPSRTSFKIIAFDLYGTLANLGAVADRCREITPDGDAFFASWRAKQLEYTFLATLMGRYKDFREITERSLDHTLERYSVKVDANQRKSLMDAWLKLAAYPEVAAALNVLGQKYELAILSNGSPSMLERGLKAAGIRPYFRWVLSAHSVKAYKPSPRVYDIAVKKTKQAKTKILFVSSNSWDAVGAKNFGLKVCWVNRAGTNFDTLGPKPDIVAKDLLELINQLGLKAPGELRLS